MEVMELLNIPDEYVVIAVAPIGYPVKEGKRTSKKTAEEVVVYNKM